MYRPPPPRLPQGVTGAVGMKKGFVFIFKNNCTITADVVVFKRTVVKAGITANLNSGRDQQRHLR